MSLHRLLPLFDRARALDQPLVLATVIRTGGSTYAKPGAQMLIAADGEYAGLLSGGCLEGDLREHAVAVAASGQSRIVCYDLRNTTDQLFGLGAGCEGAMDILLVRVGGAERWQPLEFMADAARRGAESRVVYVTASADAGLPLGFNFPDSAATWGGEPADARSASLRDAARRAPGNSLLRPPRGDVEIFVGEIAPPPRLLLLGSGPDARPVAELASFLGWRVTAADHRSSYLVPARFPPATELVEVRPVDVAASVRLDDFAAAVVMSHHLESDLHYLRALARSAIPYVGLLGPAVRREKLLGDLGEDAGLLRPRLRAPVGLDIGGRAPESIALSIVGEVHAAIAGRRGQPFSEILGGER